MKNLDKAALDQIFNEQLTLKIKLYINLLEDLEKYINKQKGILGQINDDFVDVNNKEKVKFLENLRIFVKKERKLEESKFKMINKIMEEINNG